MSYQEEFISFMVRSDVLTFGDFVTKSGRKTPFFINTGNYKFGADIAKLGEFYADMIAEKIGDDFDILYGPAYKGIPLAVSASIALYYKYGMNKSFCFNRKEAKEHGEGGLIIGNRPRDGDRIVIIEDVVTAGTSVRESVRLLKSISNIEIKALVVSVDRMERGINDNRSALQEVRDEFNIGVHSIVNLKEIVDFLYERPIDGKTVLDAGALEKIRAYSREYGVTHI
ncbi:MAG: orotate phosphoribosyltransferase [Brevinematales bacterium]|jgi:orotate phosphoribosyltransferase